jgi:anion-transporting  ArsA/GET3 family ATPase
VDLHQFFTASRLLVVAGKGGVGKTTVSAVLARAAAKIGLCVLVVELEGKTSLAEMLGGSGPLSYDGVEIDPGDSEGRGRIIGRALDPSQALSEYLDDRGLRRVSRRLATTGIIDMVSTASPGIDDILVLAKLKQLERTSPDIDLIVVDGPAAGHAITFLLSAKGLGDAVRSGPIATQAADVLELLTDATRCQVVLVTLPETTPVNELVETAYALEDRVGVHLAPLFVNGVDPLAHHRHGPADASAHVPDDTAHTNVLPGITPSDVDRSGLTAVEVGALEDAAAFRRSRARAQADELDRLRDELALAQIHLPWITTAGLTATDIDRLADELLDQVRSISS